MTQPTVPPAIVLLPCPFCAAVPEQLACFFVPDGAGGKWGAVMCTNCGAIAPEVRTGYYVDISKWVPAAAEEWNRRDGK
jgi:hypothetical protein